MKKIIQICIATSMAVWAFPAFAWKISGLGEFSFEKLTDKVYVMHGPRGIPNVKNQGFMNNPGIVLTNDGVVVVDPGSTYQVGKQILAEIKKVSEKPVLAVFNTHVHGDHWLGNQAVLEAYPEAQIYANPQMIAAAKAGEGDNWAKLMLQYTEGGSKGTKPVYPTVAVRHGDKLVISGETFVVYAQDKAHTNTDIMVAHEGSKTLFLGDNNFNKRLGRFDNTSSIYGNIAALELAKTLDMDYFVPGHGPSGNYQKTVQPFLAYLRLLEKETKAGYEEGLADYEIKKTLMKKATPYHNWTGFKDGVGRQISKMYLEIEARDL